MHIIVFIMSIFMAFPAFAGWKPIGPYGGVITSIIATKEGVYAGTEGGGIFFSSDLGKNWEGRNRSIGNHFIESLALAKDGSIYSGTRDGAYKSKNGREWELIASIPENAAIKSIVFDAYGNLIASVWGKGVFICKKDSECANPRKELSSLFVNSILPLENGDIAAATEGGVFVKPKNEDKWKLSGLLEYMVPAIACDSQGFLYAGTWGGGVHYLEKDEWNFRSMGIGSSMVATLALGPDGNLYTGTEGGVSVLSKGSKQWSSAKLEKVYIKSIAFGNSGELYAGSYGNGIFIKEKEREWEQRSKGISNSNILSVAVSGNGEIFAGTKQGLYISPKGNDDWTEVPNLYGMKVNSILLDGKRAYAGTSNGLFLGSLSKEDWKRVEGDIGYMPVTTLTRQGSFIYAGTDSDGIYRGTGEKEWAQASEGLGNMRIKSLVTLDDANVYAGTYDGVYTLQKGMSGWVKAGLQENVILSLAVHGSTVFAAAENKGIFSLSQGKWAQLEGSLPNKKILSIYHTGKGLYASGYGWLIYKEDNGPWREVTGELSGRVLQTVTSDKDGKAYVGTWGNGIWRMD